MTKSAYFLAMRETDEIDVMIRRYIKEVVSKHDVSVLTILLEIVVLLQVLISVSDVSGYAVGFEHRFSPADRGSE